MDQAGNTTEAVRQTIHAALASAGCDLESLQETILIRGGMYCGRRFQGSHGSAVWFIEESQIKYFGPDGALLQAVPAPAFAQPVRRAA
jgi:hypothetical protein